MTSTNVLFLDFTTKHKTAPFEQIKLEDYLPAFIKAIEDAKKEIDEITANQEAPTFKNTVEALEFSGQLLGRISAIFFNINAAETSPRMQELAQELSPMLAEFGNDVTLNQSLFDRIHTVYQAKESLSLSTEESMLLDQQYKRFTRNGALLSDDKKQRLREIDIELGKVSLQFGEHVLADTQDYFLHITNENDLKGLPASIKEVAQTEAQSRDLDGWVFTLDYPSYIPFMTYAENRNLRKELALAFGSKGFNTKNDNQETILKIVRLRNERANLLGYKTHADFVLEERMAKNAETVTTFLHDLFEKAKPAAEKEFQQLADFAHDLDGIEQLQKWDSAFYSDKLKQKLFDLDAEFLKPYFELKNVTEGVFEIAKRLYGLTFQEVFDIERYHEEVQTFEVYDENDNFKAVFYADFHPRKGKRGGAWMTVFENQYQLNQQQVRPHIAIVCNFSRPTQTKPALLTFNEVTTLFHEFGHALHGILANTKYPSLSGTSVFWDFVELPSQVMENWCYQPEALQLFAKHFETGEIIPQSYIDKIKESASFLEGLATLRQLGLGMLDMAYHCQNPESIQNVAAFEASVLAPTNLYPSVPENVISTSFSHIFAGGYAAGYYSYKWAEVLDADAFEFFVEKGIFNQDVAKKFHDFVLSKGGTEHPMDLYVKFRGKKPSPDALLKRAGLV
uniref:M3 family metallopeptidase n=1 Tax=Flavobacterium sp. TaxID=239 RepID=UPI00404A243C